MQVIDAGHTYELANVDGGVQTLQFIRKEEKDGKLETMIDGTTNEEVVEVLIDRLTFLNEKLYSPHNDAAINGLKAVRETLERRTADRKNRGVEGTTQA